MKRSGAGMILESLRREHVDTVFGYPGGSVVPIFDALYGARDIRVILNRHEQAAVHAADGYARATGKVGVCIVTSGPGATNTVTGLANARLDSVPLVCVTGQVARSMLGNDVFQEADTVGITQPVTKHNYLVMERGKLGAVMRQSFHIAASGRPGPVVVDVPKDVLLENGDDEYPETVEIRGYRPAGKAPIDDVRRLADAIARARKPLFFVGGGMVVADAAGPFAGIMETTGVPSVCSLMGLGVVDSDHPLNAGMIGMHGNIAANKALSACDLLVGLGVRFDDRASGDPARFAPLAKIAHVDADPSSIGRTMRVDIPVAGDLRRVLEDLAPLLRAKADIGPWIEELEGYKRYAALTTRRIDGEEPARTPDGPPSPREIMALVNDMFPGAVIATEVGQNQMWAAQYLRFREPRRWLTSGGLGTMGYGFPAALGAKAGRPGDAVVLIAGDGSFQMNIQELATSVQEGLPVVVLILDNGYLGMVRQWQELFFDRRYSSVCLRAGAGCDKDCRTPGAGCGPYAPDFAAIAKAYGADGYRVETLRELETALGSARGARGTSVIDCRIAREENVWPIVPPGEGNDRMLYKGEYV